MLETLDPEILSKIVIPYVSKRIRDHFEKENNENAVNFNEEDIYEEIEQIIEDKKQIRYVLDEHKPTIGIITALTEEYASMKYFIENSQKIDHLGQGVTKYDIGTITTNSGDAHSLILALAGVGNINAASKAALMIERFPEIKYLIMVGIAGGIPYPEKPSERVRLGDSVISSRIGVE